MKLLLASRNAHYNYYKMKVEQHINLTHQEQQIFRNLLQFCQQSQLKTVMRVAGGWVRDKIMGKNSNDIDIALDNMKGEQFVLLLQKYSQNFEEKVSNFGVTKFNPDLSKHLETATAKYFGLSIDFVNLRSETYQENSRIPNIKMGTPLQDALRRDFTINSLFYNINTQMIQDWTEKGIIDLQQKLIRTPLQPYVTFTDDPLRVLRCFRFKSRFNFRIHESIYKALQNKDIHESLSCKVSRQRIGSQIAGILRSAHPLLGLGEIKQYKFWNIIFQVPNNCNFLPPKNVQDVDQFSFKCLQQTQKSIKEHGWHCYKQLLNSSQKNIKRKKNVYSEEQLVLMMQLSCLVIIYSGFSVSMSKNKSQPLPAFMIKQQLKYSLKISKFSSLICNSVELLETLLGSDKQINKIKVIRWLQQSEELWQLSLHIYWAKVQIIGNKSIINPIQMRNYIIEQQLNNSYLIQSHIDGKFITERGNQGPIIRIILQNTIIWRILNPKSSKQEFLNHFEHNQIFFSNKKAYI